MSASSAVWRSINSYTAQTSAKRGKKLQNFVGPRVARAVRWAKSDASATPSATPQSIESASATSTTKAEKIAARDVLQFDPQSYMLHYGMQVPPEAQQSAMLPYQYLSPSQYMRLYPVLQRLHAMGDQASARALLLAQAAAHEPIQEYLEHGGLPEDSMIFSLQNLRRFVAPQATALDAQRVKELYERARAKAFDALRQQGMTIPEAQRYAQMAVGSEEEFRNALTHQVFSGGTLKGLTAGDLASFAMMGGPFAFIPLKLLELYGSQGVRALFGDAQARENLLEAAKQRIQHDALNKSFGLGLGHLAEGVLWDLPFGTVDEGLVNILAGLEKLRTGGYTATEALTDLRKKHEEAAYTLRRSNLLDAATPESAGTLRSGDDRLSRLALLSSENDRARHLFDVAEAAAKDPYVNWYELDFGGNTALESGSSILERLSPFKFWTNWDERLRALGDVITGNDRSHSFMMRAARDPNRDNTSYETYGRFRPYAQAHQAFVRGDFNPITDSPAILRIAQPGIERHILDPRRWFGSTHTGQVEGLDPYEVRRQFDRKWGRLLDAGLLSRDDVEQMRLRMRDNPAFAAAVDFERRVSKHWAPQHAAARQFAHSDLMRQYDWFYRNKQFPASSSEQHAPQPSFDPNTYGHLRGFFDASTQRQAPAAQQGHAGS